MAKTPVLPINYTVQITNLNAGGTVPQGQFQLTIEYTNPTQDNLTLTVTDSAGAIITLASQVVGPTATDGTPGTVTVTIDYTNIPVGTIDSITVSLTDSTPSMVASDNVDNITIVSP